jgi:hypothetical protein
MTPLAARAGSIPRPVELPCAKLHPVDCAKRLRANSASELVAVAMEHGTSAHGFPRDWYSPDRQIWMLTVTTRQP